jgi:cardiolipin synthase
METERSFRILTIPNVLSLIRIALIVPIAFFVWHDNLISALIIIIIATISDFLDGIIARRLNQISELGKILDPIADKLSIGTLLIVLLCKDRIPPWLALLVVGRDAVILLTSVVCFIRKDKLVIPSNFIGKVAVNVLGLMVLTFIFDIKLLQQIFVPLSVIFVVISSFSYLKNFILLYKNKTV